MPTRPYSRLHVLLHWVFAVIIIWATVSGFANALYRLPPAAVDAINFINVSLTSVLIPLLGLRILCALDHSTVAHSGNRAMRLLAKGGHLALYVVTAVTLLTGVLMMERPINVFGLLYIQQPLHDPVLTSFFNTQHKNACIVLGFLVSGHVAAVLLHTLSGTPILRRMSL
ncbi:cytochrome b/b6 domain-containing protein [Pseudomonas sp. 5P_3.1_Bac2]|uniref:cytochrome b/b6 domain-containing protein n=1 Tax=Pseudomonas sp. 5P_3.1_Bac2 TaxID=2971617 RepID=UPI0021C9657D|nr:cytochrome b/b6 domain-containing protein [Pseudomonas sp. 5P_3.1_Bac2]MCU1717751.1 cytochrome b/b6 domain-containing protein [Pseudomonas sp. 5P_3.1_Bac2]